MINVDPGNFLQKIFIKIVKLSKTVFHGNCSQAFILALDDHASGLYKPAEEMIND